MPMLTMVEVSLNACETYLAQSTKLLLVSLSLLLFLFILWQLKTLLNTRYRFKSYTTLLINNMKYIYRLQKPW